ncbi:hypothetical protein OHS70_38220 [Streptomyces sp. NBC_00390]|uniref:hypothetical protein n=1 Tax=Streptomyces sp. NBC_00390 TaxID=2975736 RepID=UPI002E242C2B
MEPLKTVMQGVAVQLVISRTSSLSMCMSLRYEPTDPYVPPFPPTLTSRSNGSWGVIFWPMA